jgi:3-oxoacyl-[acyl-carrier protein] reductase
MAGAGDLAGRVGLVTGGATGLGRATCLELARRGLDVCVNYASSSGPAAEVAALVEAEGARAVAIQADVGDAAAVESLVRETSERLGPVSVLVANAGITEYVPLAEVERLTPELWERILRVNVVGAFLCAQAVAPAMREQGFGRIVVVSSNSALGGTGSSIPYVVSKGALLTLTICLARALAPHVLVNAVAPGWMLTPWVDKYLPAELAQELAESPTEPADVDDVARLVADLAGNASVTGQVVVADRGELLASL